MRFNELFIMGYTHLKFTSFPIWFDKNNIKALRLSNLSLIYRVSLIHHYVVPLPPREGRRIPRQSCIVTLITRAEGVTLF